MRIKHLFLIAFFAIIPCVATAQEVYYAKVGGYVDLPNPTPPGDYQLIESRFYAPNSNNIDVASGTSRVYILKYFTGNEVVTCDYTCVRQWLSGGRIHEDRQTGTTYYYIQCLDSHDPTPPNPPTPINIDDDNFYYNTIEGVPMQFFIWTGSEVSVMESCIGYANGRITIPSNANGYSVTYIANAAFWNIAGLTELVIPSTVNSVDDFIALGCDNLKTIICEAPYPPKTGKNPTITDNCWSSTLYVPQGAKTRYENADGWSKFGTILEIGDDDENEEGQESLSLNYSSRTIYTGYGCKLIPQISPEDMKTTYTWKSSDRTVATVSDGYVYAKSEGTTIITCETKSGAKATCNITVVSAKKGKTTVEIKNKISNLDVLVRATQLKLSK